MVVHLSSRHLVCRGRTTTITGMMRPRGLRFCAVTCLTISADVGDSRGPVVVIGDGVNVLRTTTGWAVPASDGGPEIMGPNRCSCISHLFDQTTFMGRLTWSGDLDIIDRSCGRGPSFLEMRASTVACLSIP